MQMAKRDNETGVSHKTICKKASRTDAPGKQDTNTKQYDGVNKSQGLAFDKRVNVINDCGFTVHHQCVHW